MPLRVLVLVLLLQAPPVTPQTELEWDQPNASAGAAQRFTYRYYVDADPMGHPFSSVSCTGTTQPVTCWAAMPAFTLGTHEIRVTAASTPQSPESGKSLPFQFTFVLTVGVPGNIPVSR